MKGIPRTSKVDLEVFFPFLIVPQITNQVVHLTGWEGNAFLVDFLVWIVVRDELQAVGS